MKQVKIDLYQVGLLLLIFYGCLIPDSVVAQPLFCSRCGAICTNATCDLDGHPCFSDFFFPNEIEPARKPRERAHPRLTVITAETALDQTALVEYATEVFALPHFVTLSPFYSAQIPGFLCEMSLNKHSLKQRRGITRQQTPLSFNTIYSFIQLNMGPGQLNFYSASQLLLAVFNNITRKWIFIRLSFYNQFFYLWVHGQNNGLAFFNIGDVISYLSELTHSIHACDVYLFSIHELANLVAPPSSPTLEDLDDILHILGFPSFIQ